MNASEVEVSKFIIASVGDYTVHENEVWLVFSISGRGKDRVMGLEQPSASKRTYVNIFKDRYFKVIYPDGYIRI